MKKENGGHSLGKKTWTLYPTLWLCAIIQKEKKKKNQKKCPFLLDAETAAL